MYVFLIMHIIVVLTKLPSQHSDTNFSVVHDHDLARILEVRVTMLTVYVC